MPHRACETGSPDQASLDALLRSGRKCGRFVLDYGVHGKLFAKSSPEKDV